MCGTKLGDRFSGGELRERLDVDDMALVLQQSGLQWCGHVLRVCSSVFVIVTCCVLP